MVSNIRSSFPTFIPTKSLTICDRRPSGSTLAAPKASLSKLPQSSFATKISARFALPQKGGSVLDVPPSSSRTSLLTSPSSTANARPSYESVSSTSSRRRSTTPCGTRPVITISRTDNLDEFRDLFTIEMPARPSPAVKQASGSPESDATNSSAQSTPVIQSLEPTYKPKRGQTPASILAAAIRDQQAHQRQPSDSSRNSQRTSDSYGSSNDMVDGRTTPRLSSPQESSRSSQLPEKSSSQSLPTRGLSKADKSSVRSRTKTSMGKPPSIPLPALPSGPPPGIPSYMKTEGGVDLSELDSRASDTHSIRRPRALTTSSLPEVPVNNPSLPVIDADEIDIDAASVQQLQALLRKRNKQLEELTTFMLRKEEAWASERKVMEKKISSLQRDVIRRDSEITGLKLILSDEDMVKQPKPLPAGILNQSRLSPISTTSQSDHEGPKHTSTRRVNYQSDSGAESPRSGNESSSSILRTKKMHQRSTALAGELTFASRTGSSGRTTKFPPSCSDKLLTESPYSKRLSMMSIASSASTSSSLMPPSPSITVSSLSAIPEGSSSVNASNNNEERRATRISRRISASSMTSSSSSTAASSAYSNIKRSRPPSIAQVLEKSPNMDDILDKLRPFA